MSDNLLISDKSKSDGSYLKEVLEVTPLKTAALMPLTTYLKNHPSKTKKTCGILLEK